MARKQDVKRLLSKGGLSGRETGKLVVEHAYAVDRGEPGFLSDKDIQTLKAGLKNSRDIQDYNVVLDLYKAVYMTIQEARIVSLQVEKDLLFVEGEQDRYLLAQSLHQALSFLPVIVTEKDYKAMQASQKRKLRKRLYCLGEVLEERTKEHLGGFEEAEEATDEAWDEAWKAADQEVQKLIDAGKLKPLRLGHKASHETVQKAREYLEDPLEMDLEDEDLPEEGKAQAEANLVRMLAEAEEVVAQGDLTEGHDVQRWSGSYRDFSDLDGSDDEDRLLYHYVSGDQLYKAGLPEWKRRLDEFVFYEEEAAGVAVLQDDGFGTCLDKKGHFSTFWLDIIRSYATLPTDLEEEFLQLHGVPMEELFQTTLKRSKDQARLLQAYLQVLQEASTVSGIDLALKVVLSVSDVRKAADGYSEMAKKVSRWLGRPRGPRLPAFDLDKVKPDKTLVDILHERFALGVYGDGLGGDWWKVASDG